MAATHPRVAEAPGSTDDNSPRLIDGTSLGLFFPENVFAAFAFLAMPFWIVDLLAKGQYTAALEALTCTAIGAGLGWGAWKHKSKVLLYFAILILVLAAWLARDR